MRRAARDTHVVDPSAERSARNEALFRKANERIVKRRDDLNVDSARTPFLCECDDVSCAEVVLLTREEYARVRAHGRRFLVAHSHLGDHSRVVEDAGRFMIVEKVGDAGTIAEALDDEPR